MTTEDLTKLADMGTLCLAVLIGCIGLGWLVALIVWFRKKRPTSGTTGSRS